jgi:putative ABC transport system permease protein
MPGSLVDEVRLSARALARSPAFTGAAVATVALGLAAFALVFSFVHAVLLRPLPYPQAERLLWLFETSDQKQGAQLAVAPANFLDWRTESRTFSQLSGFHNWTFTLLGAGEPERLTGAAVDEQFLPTLGIEPWLGRNFRREETLPGGDAVVLLSFELWQERFAGRREVLGTSITLDGLPHTVVGVLPQGFELPNRARIWRALVLGDEASRRDFRFLRVLGRLGSGASLASARTDLAAVMARVASAAPSAGQGRGAGAVPLSEELLGKVRPSLLLLGAAVALVLAIAAVNLGNLSLARQASRRNEVALRRALGAPNRQLIQRSLWENLLVTTAGAALALVGSALALGSLVRLSPADLPRLRDVRLDAPVVLATQALAVALGLALGLLSALTDTRSLRPGDLAAAGSRFSPRGLKGRSTLVVGQVALALALLVGGGLVVRSYQRLLAIDPGFDPAQTLVFNLTLPAGSYRSAPQADAFFAELLDRLRTLPGVEAAASTLALPLAGGMDVESAFTLPDAPRAPGERAVAKLRPVSLDYLSTMEIPLVEGRGFTSADARDAPPVVVVSATLARRYLGGSSPLGRRLQASAAMGSLGALPEREWTVVGVAADVRHQRLDADPAAEAYFPTSQSTWWQQTIVVRSASDDPLSLLPAVRARIAELDPTLPLSQVRTLESVVARSIAQPRLIATLLAAFAALALALALVGLYGLLAYSVDQRRHELGVRLALGADRRDLLRLVLGHGLRLALLGVALGGLLSLALTRWLSSLLHGLSSLDPPAWVAAASVLLLTALAASYLPARQASRLPAASALRTT